jgi:hypothetical protein
MDGVAAVTDTGASVIEAVHGSEDYFAGSTVHLRGGESRTHPLSDVQFCSHFRVRLGHCAEQDYARAAPGLAPTSAAAPNSPAPLVRVRPASVLPSVVLFASIDSLIVRRNGTLCRYVNLRGRTLEVQSDPYASLLPVCP